MSPHLWGVQARLHGKSAEWSLTTLKEEGTPRFSTQVGPVTLHKGCPGVYWERE